VTDPTPSLARHWMNVANMRGDEKYPNLADAEILQVEAVEVPSPAPILWLCAILVPITLFIIIYTGAN
jgi:hypothetical protein